MCTYIYIHTHIHIDTYTYVCIYVWRCPCLFVLSTICFVFPFLSSHNNLNINVHCLLLNCWHLFVCVLTTASKENQSNRIVWILIAFSQITYQYGLTICACMNHSTGMDRLTVSLVTGPHIIIIIYYYHKKRWATFNEDDYSLQW